MPRQDLQHQGSFGAVLTAAVPHLVDVDVKGWRPYTVMAEYFIEFDGDVEDLMKAISKLPMVEIVFAQVNGREVSAEEDCKQ
jgi:hypothetical protein